MDDTYCPRCGGDLFVHVLSMDPHDPEGPDIYLCADQLEEEDQ